MPSVAEICISEALRLIIAQEGWVILFCSFNKSVKAVKCLDEGKREPLKVIVAVCFDAHPSTLKF
jgi:hypothetical protein